jgi:hypothetical protein
MSRFMAATGTLDDRHEIVIGSICTVDDVEARHILQFVVCENNAFKHLGDEAIRGVNEFIHGCGENGFLT